MFKIYIYLTQQSFSSSWHSRSMSLWHQFDLRSTNQASWLDEVCPARVQVCWDHSEPLCQQNSHSSISVDTSVTPLIFAWIVQVYVVEPPWHQGIVSPLFRPGADRTGIDDSNRDHSWWTSRFDRSGYTS